MALNTDERLQKKGSKTEGPPVLGRNIPPMKHKTHLHFLSDLLGVCHGVSTNPMMEQGSTEKKEKKKKKLNVILGYANQCPCIFFFFSFLAYAASLESGSGFPAGQEQSQSSTDRRPLTNTRVPIKYIQHLQPALLIFFTVFFKFLSLTLALWSSL